MMLFAKILILILSAWVGDSEAYTVTDMRICHVLSADIVRDADGKIARSQTILHRYQSIHPCPSTGKTAGACPGWALDHVIPLDCGGCDSVENLQWLKNSIKSCAGIQCKDRWERKINCTPAVLVP